MYTRPSWCAFMQYCTLKLLSMHALLAGGLLPRALEEFNVARSHHTAIPLQRLCRGRPTIKLHVGLSRHPTVAARGKFDAILDHLEAPEEVEDVLSCRRERQAAHPQHRCSRGAPDRISAISRGSPSGIAAGLGAVARKIPAAPSALTVRAESGTSHGDERPRSVVAQGRHWWWRHEGSCGHPSLHAGVCVQHPADGAVVDIPRCLKNLDIPTTQFLTIHRQCPLSIRSIRKENERLPRGLPRRMCRQDHIHDAPVPVVAAKEGHDVLHRRFVRDAAHANAGKRAQNRVKRIPLGQLRRRRRSGFRIEDRMKARDGRWLRRDGSRDRHDATRPV
mmetsp:Transcript_9723/g.36492  ORF Transcript_9723/g.36492 Transcript_9723/m.36492 type:complete len:334 (+) Transcript_9723:300-1301(+)